MGVRLDAAGTAHRPWERPRRPWSLAMRWHDLAFLHWPVDPAVLRAGIPAGLEVDTFDGRAWLGVVPFRMSGVRPRVVPAVPGVSAFPELNVRTYVSAEGKPGVWFYSLDVTKRLAVVLARTFFHLPYNRARMAVGDDGDWIDYSSARVEGGETLELDARYRPAGPCDASDGSLDAWLTERYCLYAADAAGRVFRGDIHHERWPLERAEVEIRRNTMLAPFGSDVGRGEPIAHFARDLDVVAWGLRRVRGDGAT